MLVVGAIEQVERRLTIAEAEVDERERRRRHVLPVGHPLQLTERRLGIGAGAADPLHEPEVSDDERAAFRQRRRAPQLGDRVVEQALLGVGGAEPPVRSDVAGIELQRLAELIDRLGGFPRIQQAPAAIGGDDRRAGIGVLGAGDFGHRIADAADRGQIHRVLVVGERRAGVDLDAAPELRFGRSAIPVEPQPDVAERDMRFGERRIELIAFIAAAFDSDSASTQ